MFVIFYSIVLKGVVIEKGSVIGAGAVVTKNTTAFGLYGGVPAKLIGKRSENLSYNASYKRLMH